MPKRFVIVEGGDGTGKTTLVESLSETLRPQGWDTKTLVHRAGDQFGRYLLEYTTADRIIFNRSHAAELVYSQLYRDMQPFSPEERRALETVAQTYGVIVYCDLPAAECLSRIARRNHTEILGTDASALEALSAGVAAFEAVLAGTTFVRYSAHTVRDLEAILETVRREVLAE